MGLMEKVLGGRGFKDSRLNYNMTGFKLHIITSLSTEMAGQKDLVAYVRRFKIHTFIRLLHALPHSADYDVVK